MDGALHRRVVIVTGAASGIGAACAERFAAEGDQVVAVDMNLSALDVLVERLAQHRDDLHPSVTDVASESATAALAADVASRFGRIDVLVNNAGYAPTGAIHEISLDEWRRCMDVNLTSQFLMSRACVPAMKNRPGAAIVNLSSSSGKRAMPDSGAYAVAKHGVIGLTQSLAVDLAPWGIRVNAVCPSGVDTPLARRQIRDIAEASSITPEQARANLERGIPLGRLARSEEIASAIFWLAGPDSSFMTGASVNVSGGRLLW